MHLLPLASAMTSDVPALMFIEAEKPLIIYTEHEPGESCCIYSPPYSCVHRGFPSRPRQRGGRSRPPGAAHPRPFGCRVVGGSRLLWRLYLPAATWGGKTCGLKLKSKHTTLWGKHLILLHKWHPHPAVPCFEQNNFEARQKSQPSPAGPSSCWIHTEQPNLV